MSVSSRNGPPVDTAASGGRGITPPTPRVATAGPEAAPPPTAQTGVDPSASTASSSLPPSAPMAGTKGSLANDPPSIRCSNIGCDSSGGGSGAS